MGFRGDGVDIAPIYIFWLIFQYVYTYVNIYVYIYIYVPSQRMEIEHLGTIYLSNWAKLFKTITIE